jgi:hypothetical protein
MRREAAFLVLLLGPLCTGCDGLFHIGTRNLLYEANLIKDSQIERLAFRKLAKQAWAEVQGNCPQHFSADYACGFQDGFVDYLYAGGCGEPTTQLPKRYLRFHEQKTHGCQGLLDWYAGFRHGAAVAHHSGLRKSLVIALPPPPAPHPLPPAPPPLVGAVGPQSGPHLDPANLPMPKKDEPQAPSKEKSTGNAPAASRRPAVRPDADQLASHGPEMPPQEEAEQEATPEPKDVPDPEKQP